MLIAEIIMAIGTKNERDQIYIVNNYQEWKGIINPDTKDENGISFYCPRMEYLLQVINFFLETSIFKVIERLGKLSVFPAVLLFIIKLIQGWPKVP
jgi:hypothetical protein